jgi:polysaccharide pyruvyl transferase WcaK-like protein
MFRRRTNRNQYQFLKMIKWYVKNRNRILTLSQKLVNCDAVIIGGGELIQDNNFFLPALYIWVKEIRKRNIPIYYFGIGVTSIMRHLSDRV